MGVPVDHPTVKDKEVTLYAGVSNPIDAWTVRPKYGFAGEPIPPEYWIDYRKTRTLRKRLMRFLRYRVVRGRL